MSESVAAPAAGFVRKGLLRLSWPLLVVTVFTLLATLGNVVLLNVASPALNAAVATSNQILGILYDVSVLFSLGALVVIAQLLGASRFAQARRATVVALRASALLGIVMAVFIAAAGPWLVGLVNTPAEIADDAIAYLWIVAGGLLFNAYIVAASAVLRAYGRTVALLVLGVVVNLLDVALLALFLLVLDLGVVAAALPTLIVRGIGVVLLWWIIRLRTGARFFGALPPKDDRVASGPWTMARLSIPTVVENSVFNIAVVTTIAMINLLGTDAINARSYALTLTALVTGVILALAQGNETIVGWDIGEETRRHALRQTVRTATGAAIAAAVLALLLWFFADTVLSIFAPPADVLAVTKDALLISAILLPLSAVSAVVYGALRSAGDVAVPMVISIAASLVVLVPASLLFVPVLGLGVAGAFWALVAAEAVKAALLLARWLRGGWMLRATVAGGAPAATEEATVEHDPAVLDAR